MSGKIWLGAAAGYAASKLAERGRNREDQLLMLARLSAVTPVPLPIVGSPQAEVRFTAHGAFSFALPQNFVVPDPEIQRVWQMGSTTPILAAAVDGVSPDMFFAVYDGSDIAQEMRTHSVWLIAAVADQFRDRSRAVGTPVIMGPTAILIDGERAIWFVLSKLEDGAETHKFTVETFHKGHGYVIIMHLRNGVDAKYADAFWTAIGSWKWADSAAPVGGPQPSPPMPPSG